MKIDLIKLGASCRDFRRSQNLLISDIAESTGYTEANISSFEKGKIKSFQLLIYYLSIGMEMPEVVNYER